MNFDFSFLLQLFMVVYKKMVAYIPDTKDVGVLRYMNKC